MSEAKREQLRLACEQMLGSVNEDSFGVNNDAIDEAERLLGAVRHLCGVACKACGGVWTRLYGSTATWRGGIGGAAMTVGTCSDCWGSGRVDRAGVDLRRLEAMQRRLTAKPADGEG